MRLFLQMGIKGWHWSCWTLTHWSGYCKESCGELKFFVLNIFSDCSSLFQVDDLGIFLMMIQNSGVYMQTLLAVLEGLCTKLAV